MIIDQYKTIPTTTYVILVLYYIVILKWIWYNECIYKLYGIQLHQYDNIVDEYLFNYKKLLLQFINRVWQYSTKE